MVAFYLMVVRRNYEYMKQPVGWQEKESYLVLCGYGLRIIFFHIFPGGYECR